MRSDIMELDRQGLRRFSFLFAAGMLSLIVFFEKHIQSSVLITVFAIPCLIGIIFLSIRVSMLIGGNG